MWNANPIFSMGDVTLQVLQSLLASFKDSRSAVEDLRTQLTKIVSDMNDQATRLAEIAIRGRMGVRAHFGKLDRTRGIVAGQEGKPTAIYKADCTFLLQIGDRGLLISNRWTKPATGGPNSA